MTVVKLKKILSNPDTRRIVSEFTGLLGTPVAIEELDGVLVAG